MTAFSAKNRLYYQHAENLKKKSALANRSALLRYNQVVKSNAHPDAHSQPAIVRVTASHGSGFLLFASDSKSCFVVWLVRQLVGPSVGWSVSWLVRR